MARVVTVIILVSTNIDNKRIEVHGFMRTLILSKVQRFKSAQSSMSLNFDLILIFLID